MELEYGTLEYVSFFLQRSMELSNNYQKLCHLMLMVFLYVNMNIA